MGHTFTSPTWQHAMLARSPVGHVSVCPECRVVHLSMDCVSVRLEVNAFLALAEMLSQAQQRLHSVQPHEGHAHPESAHVVH